MRILLTTFFVMLTGFAMAQDRQNTSAGQVVIETMLTDLVTPWALAFLPDGRALVTEREGELLFFDVEKVNKIRNLPRVYANRQGGLLDVVVARDFDSTQEIFLSYAAPRIGGGSTTLAKARLNTETMVLENLDILYQQPRASRSGVHFGSRIVEAEDGTLYLTIGDRGDRDLAQSLAHSNGKVIRVTRDGAVPQDNPFINTPNALPEIYSYGHRNPQGAALAANGKVWTVEHGARGGDEVNLPLAGRNYGWPVISYGRHYSGAKIGEGTRKEGMEQPAFYWDPSIAPSGMMSYSGKLFKEWKDDLFVGSLKFDYISRLDVSGDKADETEQLFKDTYGRIRDIEEAPDGSIWFLSIAEGAAFRMRPAPR